MDSGWREVQYLALTVTWAMLSTPPELRTDGQWPLWWQLYGMRPAVWLWSSSPERLAGGLLTSPPSGTSYEAPLG